MRELVKLRVILLGWFILVSTAGFSQGINLSLSDSEFFVTNNELISFSMKLENYTSQTIKITPQFNYNTGVIQIVNEYRDGFILKANEQLYIPVKAIISSKAGVQDEMSISVDLLSDTGVSLDTKVVKIGIKEKKMLKMLVLKENLIFEQEKDTLLIPVKIANMGNTHQKVTVITRFMKVYEKNTYIRSQYELKAFSDTVVYVKKIIDQEIIKADNFRITIKGLYSDGNVFGSGTVIANSVKQKRRFTYPTEELNPNGFQQNNLVRSSILKNGDNMQYFFYANNEFDFKSGTLQSNIDFNYFENTELFLLRNTWLSYSNDHFGMKAGNIFGTDVINLIGRGVETHYEKGKYRYEAGALDKSFNLINNTGYDFGRSAWARLIHNGGWSKNGFEMSLMYDDDPIGNFRSYFVSTGTNLINKENIKLSSHVSLSNSGLMDDSSVNKTGGAAEVNFFVKKGNVGFTSSNFASTGYYAGLRKGILNFVEKVNYSFDKYMVWGSFNIFQFKPKNLSETQFIVNDFSIHRYDIGVSRRFKNLTLILTPTHYNEWRENFGQSFQELGKIKMSSSGVVTGINYSALTNKHNFSIRFTSGMYSSNLLDDNRMHFKGMFNYSYRNFRLSGFYQHNHFLLGELFSTVQFDPSSSYRLINVVPSYSRSFFNDKLRLDLGLAYTETVFNRGNFQFNGRADYELPGNFSIFLTTFYSDFSSNYYESSAIQFGVIKRFSKVRVDQKRYNLRVVIYRNEGIGNEIRKVPAANELVLVGDEAFRTDEKGVIEYRKLPEGIYRVRVMSKKEWYTPDTKVNLTQNTDKEILLNKTASIVGKISYETTELSHVITKEYYGLPVTAVDTQGNEFSSRTDNKGNFRLYVPEGTYTIRFEKPKRMDVVEVINNNQFVETHSGQMTQIHFILKVKERRVERKRF